MRMVCIGLSLAVCYSGYSNVCPWWDNGRILCGEAVGGSGQRSQWVKRLLGCVSTRPWWGCRRKSSTTRQCSDEHPFSYQTEEHTANKSAGEMKPFIHLPSDALITGMEFQWTANYSVHNYQANKTMISWQTTGSSISKFEMTTIKLWSNSFTAV